MTTTLAAERRAAPRYSLVEPAVVEVASWTELVALYTRDISHGGMFVQTDAPPERDTRVAVRLLLPDGAGTVELEGVVVHVVTAAQARETGWTAGFGLQFSGLTAERRQALQRLVEQAKGVAAPEGHRPGSTRAGASPRHRVPSRLTALMLESLRPASARRERVCDEPGAGATRCSTTELARRSEQLAAQLKRRSSTTAPSARGQHRALVDEALRLVADKRYAAAIERLELVLQRTPDPQLRVLLCVVQARQALLERDFLGARARYQAVLELDPDNAVAQRELLMLSALRR